MPRPPKNRPWVSANFAITWDGRISTRSRTPSDFSSPLDKRRFLEIRALADAILVGAATATADRMTMGLPDLRLREARRERGQSPYPLRVIITNSGRLDPDLPLFSKRFSPIHIYSTRRMPARLRESFGSHVHLHLASKNGVDLPGVLQQLRHEHGIRRLHCEGGGRVLRSLLEADCVDEIYLTLCPRVFGSLTAATLTGTARDFLPHSVHCTLAGMETIGDECFLRYRVIH